jgi:hypothetical protein
MLLDETKQESKPMNQETVIFLIAVGLFFVCPVAIIITALLADWRFRVSGR